MYKYVYPITRYSELKTTVYTLKPLRGNDALMRFYEDRVRDEDRLRILEWSNAEDYYDPDGYLQLLLDNPNADLTYGDLLGNAYEVNGTQKLKNEPNTFYVNVSF